MKNDIIESIINEEIQGKKSNKKEKLIWSSGIEIESKICNDLKMSTREYVPSDTFEIIHSFVSENNKTNRVLLSEIISELYSLNDDQSSIFITNLNTLKGYSDSIQNDEKKYDDTKKFIVKLYDYVHLFIFQDYKVDKFFADKIEQSKSDLKDEVKQLQSQYITILGIFASFVVTFVGGLSFSSSVLNSISSVSAYRLFVVILLLGFVLLTICFSLYWFIAKIVNNVDINNLECIYKTFTIGIAILLFACLCFWCNGYVEKRNKKISNLIKSTWSDIIGVK